MSGQTDRLLADSTSLADILAAQRADILAAVATSVAAAQAAATQAQQAAAQGGSANVRSVLLSNVTDADRGGGGDSSAALASAKTQAGTYPGAPIECERGVFKVAVGSAGATLGPYTTIRDGTLVATGAPAFSADPFDTTLPGYDPAVGYVPFITTPDNPDGLQTSQKSVMEGMRLIGGAADPSKSNLIVRDIGNNAAVDNRANSVEGGRIGYRFRGMQFFKEDALKAFKCGVGVLGYPLKGPGGSNSGLMPSLHIAECQVGLALVVPKGMDYPPGAADLVFPQLELLGSKVAGFALRGLTKNGTRYPGQATIIGGAPEHTDEHENGPASYRIVPNPADRSEDFVVPRCSGYVENFDLVLQSYRFNEAELHTQIDPGTGQITKVGASLIVRDTAFPILRDCDGPGSGKLSDVDASAGLIVEGRIKLTGPADGIVAYRGNNRSTVTHTMSGPRKRIITDVPNLVADKVRGDFLEVLGSGLTAADGSDAAGGYKAIYIPAGGRGQQLDRAARWTPPKVSAPIVVVGFTIEADADIEILMGLDNNGVAALGKPNRTAQLRAGKETFVPHCFMGGDYAYASVDYPRYYFTPNHAIAQGVNFKVRKWHVAAFASDEPITRGALDEMCRGGWNPNG